MTFNNSYYAWMIRIMLCKAYEFIGQGWLT